MNTPRSVASGFTLVEVLVALAVMSLIGTLLIESLRVGGHAWQQVTRRAANINEVVRAQSFLRRRLATLSPTSSSDAAQDSFIGERDAIEFSSVSADHFQQGSMRFWIGLSRSESANLDVRYRLQPAAPGVAPSAWVSESLVDRVASVTMEFWEAQQGGGRWIDHWNDSRNLPAVIRIEVEFANQDSRRWPPLYVEPKLDTPVTCVFDVVSRRCREAM